MNTTIYSMKDRKATRLRSGGRMTDEGYRKYLKDLEGKARRFARSNRIPLDDLMGVTNEAYVVALGSWIPGKASFRTYLNAVVRNHLLNYVKRLRDEVGGEALAALCVQPTQDRALSFKGAMASLSAEAREVAGLVLDCPLELAQMMEDGVKGVGAKTHIIRYMAGLGRPANSIKRAFGEIKRALREV